MEKQKSYSNRLEKGMFNFLVSAVGVVCLQVHGKVMPKKAENGPFNYLKLRF